MQRLTIALAMLSLAITLQASQYDDPKTWPVYPKPNEVEMSHIDAGIKAIWARDIDTFDQHFKTLIGHSVKDIETASNPGIYERQSHMIRGFQFKAGQKLDDTEIFNGFDDKAPELKKATQIYDLLIKWCAIKEYWK